MRKTIESILAIIAVIFLIWVCISYMEILMNNLNGDSLSFWNFFDKFCVTSK